ncbi:hypothetical protein [Thermaerobacter subterraneus]|uniref:Lipoprotein n=1 Tax=Thermaerobacter subterraneus DSM 13965 TaxID=867903 RepID=K6PMF7_9FIRM|nr:hypothetical protein [Thermaerobacter subterraneus]EKP94047.1 hypothetical protein ThesuDRAFT_01771 [Thermaerobacter subterraneus DSM 13965]
MNRVRRLPFALTGVITAVAVFLVAGCGPQAQDTEDVQIVEDEKDQVYIFPDGTQVVGTQAEWIKEVVQFFASSPTTWEEVDVKEKEIGFLKYVSVPSGFRLAKAITNGQVTRAIYVNPEQQWLFLLNAWQPGYPGRGWTLTPHCVTETEAGTPLQPLLDHLCRGEYLIDGWKIQFGVTSSDMETSRHLLVASIRPPK